MSLMILLAIATLVGAYALYVFATTLLSSTNCRTSSDKKLKDLFPEVPQDPHLFKKVSELSVNMSLIKDKIQESNKYNSQLEESQRNLQAQLASLSEMVGSLGDEVFSLQAVNRSLIEAKMPKVKTKKRRK